jgi:prepilin signal peptidase PulO-like enzyme (type II secretory pathway)
MTTVEQQRSAPNRLRSPVIMLATGLVAGGVAVAQGSVAHAVLRGVLVLVLVACAVTDLERRIIPNRITGPAALLGLALGLALDPAGEPKRLLWAAIAGGFMVIAVLANPAGLGMGDAKLTVVMGLYLGPAVVVGLFFALLSGLVAGLVVARRRGIRVARKTTMPFGPFLAAGGIFAALLGDALLHVYLHHL